MNSPGHRQQGVALVVALILLLILTVLALASVRAHQPAGAHELQHI